MRAVTAPTPPADAVQSAPPGSSAGALGRRGLRRLVPVALLLVFLGLALALLSRGVFASPYSFPGVGKDPALFIWDLAWVAFALTHHVNPLVTTYIHYPGGANLMWNTSIIFPGIVLAPLTLWADPFVAYKALMVLSVGLSGWCATLALRRVTERWIAAVAGGLVYGFSPYMTAQALGHPQVAIAIYPPLLAILAHEILARERRSATLLGVLLGVATAAQLLTGEEVLAMTAIMAIPALMALFVMRRTEVRRRAARIRRAALAGAVTFIVLAAYPLAVQLFGPQRVFGAVQPADVFVLHLHELFAPSSLQLVAPFGHTGFRDTSTYLGLPLTAVALFTIVWLRRRAVVVVSAVVLVCALVLSLGGVRDSIPLPWLVFEHLPVFADILAVRLVLFAYLALGVLLALFIDASLARAASRLAAGAAVAVAGITLLSFLPAFPYPSGRYAVPAFFTAGEAARLDRSGSVLLSPYGGVEPLTWQAVSGIAFRTQLGLVFTPGPAGGRPQWSVDADSLGAELMAIEGGAAPPASLSPGQREAYLADLRSRGVSSVVVGPSPGESGAIRLFTELLGRPGTATGGVVVWNGIAS
jgi:hypothetical protein